jgi:hypothetical protein
LEEQDEKGLGVRLKKHMEMLYWVRLSSQKTQQLHCIERENLGLLDADRQVKRAEAAHCQKQRGEKVAIEIQGLKLAC